VIAVALLAWVACAPAPDPTDGGAPALAQGELTLRSDADDVEACTGG
jgi:hypothetical protein